MTSSEGAFDGMEKSIFSPMEMDAIGEIMNISIGSSATAVSNMLDHRVDITTPSVSVVMAEEFVLRNMDPAIGVVIKYVTGLSGSNIMMLKRSDVKIIVDILMGSETPDDEFELNDLTISAVCEVMNQMMGAASTALSDFLGEMVNISTPQSFELNDLDDFKRNYFPATTGPVVVVKFILSIEGALRSEFMNIMSVDLARGLVSGFGLGEEEEAPPAQQQPVQQQVPVEQPPIQQQAPVQQQPVQQPVQQPLQQPMQQQQQPVQQQPMQQPVQQQPMQQQQQTVQQPPMQQPMQQQQQPIQQPMQQPPLENWQQAGVAAGYPGQAPYPYPPQAYMPQPKVIQTQPVHMPQLDLAKTLGEEQAQNLELIMSVPLEVTVEIGRTCRKVQDILGFAKGSLVVLDKLAGDQVDVFVNGKCIARGDVVVIDDNFGIRITEIMQKPGVEQLIQP